METGLVRGILWAHLRARHGDVEAPTPDPNALVPAAPLAAALQRLQGELGRHAVRALGRDYAQLWQRTFRRLVLHLRGRPEDMLRLFALEVWPYLRGDRLASRLEPGRFRVRLHDDLPPDYVAGMLEGFVGLSGARVQAHPGTGGAWRLDVHTPAGDLLARAMRLTATIRLPVLLAALFAAVAGLAAVPGAVDAPLRVGAVLVGVAAAQAAANVVPDLRARPQGPLAVADAPRAWLWAQLVGSAAVAGGAATYLTLQAPWVPAFAVLGVLLGIAYTSLHRRGMGPLVTALVHGPVIGAGAAYAVAPAGTLWPAAIAAVPIGLASAALAHLGDMADRPLDMARGHRTLAVRLPVRADAWTFAALLAASICALGAILWTRGAVAGPAAVWAAMAVAGLAVALHVARHLDDPVALAPARLGTLLLMAGATIQLIPGGTA